MRLTSVRQHLRLRLPSRMIRRARVNARRALLFGAALFAVVNVAVLPALDARFAELRDPEFAHRLALLRTKLARDSTRPTVVVLGSSRVAMGVRPGGLEEANAELQFFNFGMLGAGPIMQLLVFQRILQSGVRPAAVVCEVWPPYFRGDGVYAEAARFNTSRLNSTDCDWPRHYFQTVNAGNNHSPIPIVAHRAGIMNALAPEWLPHALRTDHAWRTLDASGWLPGAGKTYSAAECDEGHRVSAANFGPLFVGYTIAPDALEATRKLIELCDANRIPLAFVWLPESSRFRSWYTAEMNQQLAPFLDECGSAGRLIDARDWADDANLGDGFHLTQPGAAAFTTRLSTEIHAHFRDVLPSGED